MKLFIVLIIDKTKVYSYNHICDAADTPEAEAQS